MNGDFSISWFNWGYAAIPFGVICLGIIWNAIVLLRKFQKEQESINRLNNDTLRTLSNGFADSVAAIGRFETAVENSKKIMESVLIQETTMTKSLCRVLDKISDVVQTGIDNGLLQERLQEILDSYDSQHELVMSELDGLKKFKDAFKFPAPNPWQNPWFMPAAPLEPTIAYCAQDILATKATLNELAKHQMTQDESLVDQSQPYDGDATLRKFDNAAIVVKDGTDVCALAKEIANMGDDVAGQHFGLC